MRARRRGVEISLHSTRFRASSSRKLGLEQKKWNEGWGGRERRKQRFLFSPPFPRPFYFFFCCSRSNFGAITRLGTLATQAMSKWEGGGGGKREGEGIWEEGFSFCLFSTPFHFPFCACYRGLRISFVCYKYPTTSVAILVQIWCWFFCLI